jgi:hypothetical protein
MDGQQTRPLVYDGSYTACCEGGGGPWWRLSTMRYFLAAHNRHRCKKSGYVVLRANHPPLVQNIVSLLVSLPVLRIRNVYPDSEFFPSRIRIRIFSILDPGSASKNLSNLTQKIVPKLSEI